MQQSDESLQSAASGDAERRGSVGRCCRWGRFSSCTISCTLDRDAWHSRRLASPVLCLRSAHVSSPARVQRASSEWGHAGPKACTPWVPGRSVMDSTYETYGIIAVTVHASLSDPIPTSASVPRRGVRSAWLYAARGDGEEEQ
jgi:hypothetical protein